MYPEVWSCGALNFVALLAAMSPEVWSCGALNFVALRA